jgi:hypothetical protein
MFTLMSRLGLVCAWIEPSIVPVLSPDNCMSRVLANEVACLLWSAARAMALIGDSAPADEWVEPGLEPELQPAASRTAAAPAAVATVTLVERESIGAFLVRR